ncbi:non-ribosomal peptide synthetase [Actinoalloteichus hymeniacidonis]|uniref:Amino acid adenylation enzyme/thioester reductase family protein n=1 Tax=Actinoalloteichus hymeniacidonis TaxID=340345 RepID=A0AAC9HRS9_9PSEU|nr:non-ribosomal peptide synthetase [Actinoalloteichus hymeniacidonis]AOS63786.1 amino acid adenylation enzyme/thioester reductase family protein [Actinoalloteichus hymeniacidonis]MBB5908160.1 amino acid adenylation domain-containing protein [Actinoalloteichus hymeniacidonis]
MTLTDTLAQITHRGIRLSLHEDRLRISAPRGALDEDLRAAITSVRDELVQFLREREHEDERRNTRIGRADRSAPLPASFAQQRLWLIEQLGSQVPVYNMYLATRLSGPLDVAALRGAIGDMTARHEILRTALAEHGDGLVQVVEECDPVFTEHPVPPDAVDETVRRVVSHRFDLASAPLIRFDLIGCGPEEHVFVITQHHVISDGWSVGLIKKELSALYAARVHGTSAQLPDVDVHYADFAAWERHWVGGARAQRQRDFWRGQLADLPPLLDLAPGRPRASVQSYRGAALTFRYDRAFMDRIRALCAECGTTLYGGLVAAYGLLLSRMTRSADLAVGSPLASRPYPALENTLGLFFNSITVRMAPEPTMTVREYLAATRRTAFDAFAHQDLPFDQVVQAVAPHRSAAHAPLFQAVFILQSYPESPLDLTGVRASAYSAPIYAAQYDLMLKLREVDGGAEGLLIHNDELLDAEDAARFASWFRQLLTVLADAPDTPLSEVSLLDAEDTAALTRANAATERPIPPETVPAQIVAALRAAPDAPAVTFRDRTLRGGRLADQADAIAVALAASGLRPGDRVAVRVGRSPELVSALLGVMRAGMAYVPLDGTIPAERARRILTTAECAAVLLSPGEDAPEGFTGPVLTVPVADPADAIPPAADRPPLPVVDGDSTAYVIFTSGSTGMPKGVEVTHGNLMNLFVALDEAVPLPADARWLAVTNVTFDIAVVELLWTLARGVPVVLGENGETIAAGYGPGEVPLTVPESMAAHAVTAMQATPSFLRSMLRLPGATAALRRLRLLMVGGEPLDPALATALTELDGPTVLNMYGPTETTVWSTAWTVPAAPERVLVGSPLANTTLHVVDAELRPVPVGMVGELVIGGAGVTRGYVGSPDLTTAVFGPLPGVDAGKPVYRTGDLARLRPDGTVELAGRIDNQVKVDGYRIELEEVERALAGVPGIAACAAAVQREDHRAHLVAHYVPAGPGPGSATTIQAALAALLPPPAIPVVFAETQALPLNPNGKLDRAALPKLAVTGLERDGAAIPAAGELEETLLAVWRSVLGREEIGVTDDFFLAGGNSILVARLLSEVRAAGVPAARIVDLFRFPSVRAFVANLTGPEQPAPAANTGPAPSEAALRRRRQVLRKRRERDGDT